MSSQLLFSYGVFLIKMGRVKEALAYLERAQVLDPLDPAIGSKFGYSLLLNNRIDESLTELERVWALNRGNRFIQSTDGLLVSMAVNDQDAINKWLARVVDYCSPEQVDGFSTMVKLSGDRKAALTWLKNAFERREFNDYWISNWAAYYHDQQLALNALLRSPDAYSLWAPQMADLRRQPAFKDIVSKMGLDEYWRNFTWTDFCHPVGDRAFECG
jgi:tetratricopeptide (TPR) repeat protein